MRSLPEVFWILLVFLVVVGGIMLGYFTPTEAGAVGTFAVLLLAVVKRDMTFKKYVKSTKEALRTAIMILMLVAGSTVLGHFITVTNIPQHTATWVAGLPINRYLIMILICIIYELGGSFIDDLTFMILATPIFYPAVIKLGYDPIWFGIMIGITIMIGVIIPPVAICVFIVRNITGVPFNIIYRGVMPFLIALAGAAFLLFLFPQIALYLPNLFMGS